MNGAFGSRTHRRRPSINITPLIDVMFLLIIFFMVSSTFHEQLGIRIDLPQAGTASQQERPPHEITVKANGQFFLGQALVNREQLAEGLRGMLREEPEAVFVLRADERAPFQHVITAIDIARAVGGNRLIIPAEPMEQADPTGEPRRR